MQLVKVDNYEEMSKKACSIIMEHIQENRNPVIGLATGSTPEKLYSCLIDEYKQGKVSFENVTTFNLDEYVGLKKDDANSYHHYMKEKLFDHVGLGVDQVHLPDGHSEDLEQDCLTYEKQIEEAGGIDIQVLGLGLNGHIGFNEPGTPFSSRTHVVELSPSTRSANARFFSSIEEVPTQAISMGIASIMASKKILLLVSGKQKAEALHRLLNSELTEDFPASILQTHPDVTIIADELALEASLSKS
ncbi:glucosamine-6-phosphate deaminase [Planococcus glaciei]|uniref:Glucosamine-6-phosphate deaminase n=1 Tax=Planococcus glaciei TaxID=459472 RepID=A0A7H8Q6C5_9BACL|nr:glucosamine-6-phosphate deaminase [Planococcus glaciei]QKX49508.1 glucosamine-6-phosphate deaminase [Planococcus glaciei]